MLDSIKGLRFVFGHYEHEYHRTNSSVIVDIGWCLINCTLNGQYCRFFLVLFVCVFRLRNVFLLVHNYGLNKSGCIPMKKKMG